MTSPPIEPAIKDGRIRIDHVIGFGVRGISKGIAITSEVIAGRKCTDSVNEEVIEDNYTLREWAIDDYVATQETGVIYDEAEQVKPTESGTSDVLTTDPHLVDQEQAKEIVSNITPLPQPVIIPQRRPRDRRRGFVRAYAPSLGAHSGIDQETFITFPDTWQQASRSSPVFDVINIACLGIGMVPSTICFAVSTAVGTTAMIAQELQIRYRTNAYLDEANESLFKPRGLFAMIMTYKPEMADDLLLHADTSDPTSLAITRSLQGNSSKTKTLLRRLRKSSGVAGAEAQIPEAAPLIHPSLDLVLNIQSLAVTDAKNGSDTKGTMKQNAAIINDYLDRRAQAVFAAEHPSSKLTTNLPPPRGEKQFVNRFCDPDHPVNSGSLFGLITGGTFDPISMGRVSRAEARAKRKGEEPLTEQERHDAYMGRRVRGSVTGTPSKNNIVTRMMKKDVLYFVIVNLPGASELEDLAGMVRKLDSSQ